MNQKVKELLAVLDLPEEEQIRFLDKYPNRSIENEKVLVHGEWRLLKTCLPTLAFRLRDEVVKTCHYKYDAAIIQVYSVSKKSAESFHWWWIRHSQPIHFIIAALIAKELAKEKNDVCNTENR